MIQAKYRLKLDNFEVKELQEIIKPAIIGNFSNYLKKRKVFLCKLNKDEFEKAKETSHDDDYFNIKHINIDFFSVVMIISSEYEFKGGFCVKIFNDYIYFDDLEDWSHDNYLEKRFICYMTNDNNIGYLAWKEGSTKSYKMKSKNSQSWGWKLQM